MKKRILMTGATGMIGSALAGELCRQGAYVQIIARDPVKARKKFEGHFAVEVLAQSRYDDPESLSALIPGTDAVVNLAGANLASSRWTKSFKNEIYESRIGITETIVTAISLSGSRPSSLINASAVGIYGNTLDEEVTEESPTGSGFLAKVCKDWEREALNALKYGVRTVTLRTGIVLGKDEGAFPKLILPFRFFAGTYYGSGSQWFPWIHIRDAVMMYVLAIENESINGALNAAAPVPVTNKQLMKAIGNELGREILLPVPAFALKLAAGEFAEGLLTGQKVIPEKALQHGFKFEFPEISTALKDLLKK
ncbi:MAG: TIGR01777 family oxidoreductase [Ignavibacteria bacterium]|nr:TIGR01777 family oxidoreductase [Ignavibacteria bacterium]